MKKIGMTVCLSLALLGSTAAQAWKGNWLAGVSGGYASRQGNMDLNIIQDNLTQTTVSHDLSENGFVGGLFAGYDTFCNNWMLGGELKVDWHDSDDNNGFYFADNLGTATIANATYDRGTTVGLSGRMGFALSRYLMPYLRLGVEGSRDKLSLSTVNAAAPSVSASIDERRWVYRGLAGVGLELPIPKWEQLSFRAEYNFLSHGRSVTANGVASNNVTFLSASATQRTNEGRASLVWNFI